MINTRATYLSGAQSSPQVNGALENLEQSLKAANRIGPNQRISVVPKTAASRGVTPAIYVTHAGGATELQGGLTTAQKSLAGTIIGRYQPLRYVPPQQQPQAGMPRAGQKKRSDIDALNREAEAANERSARLLHNGARSNPGSSEIQQREPSSEPVHYAAPRQPSYPQQPMYHAAPQQPSYPQQPMEPNFPAAGVPQYPAPAPGGNEFQFLMALMQQQSTMFMTALQQQAEFLNCSTEGLINEIRELYRARQDSRVTDVFQACPCNHDCQGGVSSLQAREISELTRQISRLADNFDQRLGRIEQSLSDLRPERGSRRHRRRSESPESSDSEESREPRRSARSHRPRAPSSRRRRDAESEPLGDQLQESTPLNDIESQGSATSRASRRSGSSVHSDAESENERVEQLRQQYSESLDLLGQGFAQELTQIDGHILVLKNQLEEKSKHIAELKQLMEPAAFSLLESQTAIHTLNQELDTVRQEKQNLKRAAQEKLEQKAKTKIRKSAFQTWRAFAKQKAERKKALRHVLTSDAQRQKQETTTAVHRWQNLVSSQIQQERDNLLQRRTNQIEALLSKRNAQSVLKHSFQAWKTAMQEQRDSRKKPQPQSEKRAPNSADLNDRKSAELPNPSSPHNFNQDDGLPAEFFQANSPVPRLRSPSITSENTFSGDSFPDRDSPLPELRISLAEQNHRLQENLEWAERENQELNGELKTLEIRIEKLTEQLKHEQKQHTAEESQLSEKYRLDLHKATECYNRKIQAMKTERGPNNIESLKAQIKGLQGQLTKQKKADAAVQTSPPPSSSPRIIKPTPRRLSPPLSSSAPFHFSNSAKLPDAEPGVTDDNWKLIQFRKLQGKSSRLNKTPEPEPAQRLNLDSPLSSRASSIPSPTNSDSKSPRYHSIKSQPPIPSAAKASTDKTSKQANQEALAEAITDQLMKEFDLDGIVKATQERRAKKALKNQPDTKTTARASEPAPSPTPPRSPRVESPIEQASVTSAAELEKKRLAEKAFIIARLTAWHPERKQPQETTPIIEAPKRGALVQIIRDALITAKNTIGVAGIIQRKAQSDELLPSVLSGAASSVGNSALAASVRNSSLTASLWNAFRPPSRSTSPAPEDRPESPVPEEINGIS